jgi:hypothetical protein
MANSGQGPSLAAVAWRWLHDSRRVRGTTGTVKFLAEELWEMLKDSLPDRRRSRFGDIGYDCDHAVDTTWARLPWRIRLRELFAERLYQPTAPEEFDEVMQRLGQVDFTGFTFIDLGSGKGRALLMASMYPFERVLGVEVQPELHRIALRNLAAFCHPSQRCRHIESCCLDAREFEFPETPLLVYMFNPFPDYELSTVLDRLGESLRRNPRPVYIVYNAPWEMHVLAETPWLERLVDAPRYQIYKAAMSDEQ